MRAALVGGRRRRPGASTAAALAALLAASSLASAATEPVEPSERERGNRFRPELPPAVESGAVSAVFARLRPAGRALLEDAAAAASAAGAAASSLGRSAADRLGGFGASPGRAGEGGGVGRPLSLAASSAAASARDFGLFLRHDLNRERLDLAARQIRPALRDIEDDAARLGRFVARGLRDLTGTVARAGTSVGGGGGLAARRSSPSAAAAARESAREFGSFLRRDFGAERLNSAARQVRPTARTVKEDLRDLGRYAARAVGRRRRLLEFAEDAAAEDSDEDASLRRQRRDAAVAPGQLAGGPRPGLGGAATVQQDEFGPALFAFLAVSAILAVALYASASLASRQRRWRRRRLESTRDEEMAGEEAIFFIRSVVEAGNKARTDATEAGAEVGETGSGDVAEEAERGSRTSTNGESIDNDVDASAEPPSTPIEDAPAAASVPDGAAELGQCNSAREEEADEEECGLPLSPSARAARALPRTDAGNAAAPDHHAMARHKVNRGGDDEGCVEDEREDGERGDGGLRFRPASNAAGLVAPSALAPTDDSLEEGATAQDRTGPDGKSAPPTPVAAAAPAPPPPPPPARPARPGRSEGAGSAVAASGSAEERGSGAAPARGVADYGRAAAGAPAGAVRGAARPGGGETEAPTETRRPPPPRWGGRSVLVLAASVAAALVACGAAATPSLRALLSGGVAQEEL